MAGLVPKCGQIGALVTRSPLGSRVVVPITRQFKGIAGSDKPTVGQELKNKAASVVEEVEGVAGDVANAAHNFSTETKETAKQTWDSVKEKARNIKDTVVEESKEFVRDNAETVDRCMNSKN